MPVVWCRSELRFFGRGIKQIVARMQKNPKRAAQESSHEVLPVAAARPILMLLLPVAPLFLISFLPIAILTSCKSINTPDQQQAPPSNKIPDGLTPEEYFQYGLKYKAMGRIEMSRAAMKRVLEGAAGSVVGAGKNQSKNQSELQQKASLFLKHYLPKEPVSLEAEQRNIIAFNQARKGDTEAARQSFKSLIRDFPQFEWPYGNLSAVLLKDGMYDEAQQLLEQALKINPDYSNAWLYMAQIKKLKSDPEGAQECMRHVIKVDQVDQSRSVR